MNTEQYMKAAEETIVLMLKKLKEHLVVTEPGMHEELHALCLDVHSELEARAARRFDATP